MEVTHLPSLAMGKLFVLTAPFKMLIRDISYAYLLCNVYVFFFIPFGFFSCVTVSFSSMVTTVVRTGYNRRNGEPNDVC